jgi:hypothetical protein
MKLHAAFLTAITALTLAFPLSLRAKTQLDHFTVYVVPNSPSPDSVSVKGQFDRTLNTTRIKDLSFYSTRVDKKREGIIDKNAHLAWHACLQGANPMREVVISNQFGRQTLILGQPRFLLVPSAPKGAAISQKLDHYLAYEVLKASGPNISPVSLADDLLTSANVAVGKPKFFCVPVLKVHKDKKFPIHDPRDHLTVYEVAPAKARGFAINDQLGTFKFPSAVRRLLGVPTVKVSFKTL